MRARNSMLGWLLLISGLAFPAMPSLRGADRPGDFARDHVLVKFNDTARAQFGFFERRAALTALHRALGLPAAATLRENGLVHALLATRQANTAAERFDFAQFAYLDLPPGWTVETALARLANHPLLEYAEADGVGTGGATIPNDPSFGSQWHHRNLTKPDADIRSTLVWDTTTGSSNIILAVLDTGVNLASGEFTNRLVAGYDFANNDADPSDDQGHGTAVTGTAAAIGNNAFRVAGVDWRCRIMPVKVLDAANSGLYSWWASGINFAVSNGAKVINLSAGGSTSNLTLTTAILNAINAGVIFVTITHNDGTNVVRFPGRLTNCITVGATDTNDQRTGFSNYGPEIDLVAPGTNIYTIGLAGTVQFWWGTSFAAPQVSGAACLLASIKPSLTHDEARTLLCAGADDLVGDATDTPGFDNYYGWGRLNIFNSLTLLQTAVTNIANSSGQVTLAWKSPTNVAAKIPYQIQFAATPADPWQTITNSAKFSYSTNSTVWTDDGSETGSSPVGENSRAYRVWVQFP